jgi:hypothetical protein
MNSKKTQELKNDLFYLITYLITSARGLLDDPFLQDLKNRISEEMAGSMNSQRQREKLDELLEMVTMEINRRL